MVMFQGKILGFSTLKVGKRCIYMPVEDGEQHHYNTSFCTIVAHCAFWTLVTNFDFGH